MYEVMSADEAIRLIRDGDCICVNSFVGSRTRWSSTRRCISGTRGCSLPAI